MANFTVYERLKKANNDSDGLKLVCRFSFGNFLIITSHSCKSLWVQYYFVLGGNTNISAKEGLQNK